MLERPHIDRNRIGPALAGVLRLHHESTEPGLRLVGPGPVAPFLRMRMRAPRRLLRLDAALEEAGDRHVDQERSVLELANAAIPIALRLRPGKDNCWFAPALAAVVGTSQQSLAAVMMKRKTFLIENSDEITVLQGARRDLIDAVLFVLEDRVMLHILDGTHILFLIRHDRTFQSEPHSDILDAEIVADSGKTTFAADA